MKKSCEQRLVTKAGPHSNAYTIMFKSALYFSALVMKLLRIYYCNTVNYLLNASLSLGMHTFKTEVLHLVSNVQHCLAFLWQKFTTQFIIKAMPISYIDSKCHIKKLKNSGTCLICYSGFNYQVHPWFKNFNSQMAAIICFYPTKAIHQWTLLHCISVI